MQSSILWIIIVATPFTIRTSDVAEEEQNLQETTVADQKVEIETEKPEENVDTTQEDEGPKVHHIDCLLTDHFCSPSANDLITKIEDQDVVSATECRKFCIEDVECNYFTYIQFRGGHSCYTLKNCTEWKPVCNVPSNCVSGQKDCKNQTVCPKLHHTEGDQTRWICDEVNPYKEDIPENTACHTSCPDWRNEAGKQVTAKSTCQSDSSWSEISTFPPGPLYFPTSLNKPDGPDMGCHCHPLNITYNPNLEDGTEFFCNTAIDWDNLPVKMDDSNICHLLCDKMLIAIMECKKGLWTGSPDRGFWCNYEKESLFPDLSWNV